MDRFVPRRLDPIVQKRLTGDAGATGEHGTEGIFEGNDNEDTKNVARYGRLKKDRNAGDWLTVGTDLPKNSAIH